MTHLKQLAANRLGIAAMAVCGTLLSTNTATAQVAQVTDILIQSVEFQQGQLVALAEVTLEIAGETVTQDVEIPLSLEGTLDEATECGILNLALGPIDLDLLGLVVELDDCEGGPVVVDIVAMTGDDNLLGNLLCGLAGALDGGLPLDELTGDELDAIQEVVQSVLDEFLMTAQTANSNGGGGNRRCDILTLEIPDGLTLDLLGLVVDTSGICLDVYAERGGGNLLGNLLCTVTNLLDGNANQNAVNALLRNIRRLLGRLGL
jgi:hypothetical protein